MNPDVIALQNKTTVNIGNDNPSHLLAEKTNFDIPTDNNDINALFQERNYKVQLNVGMCHPSSHPVVSTLDTGTVPALFYRSVRLQSWRNHTRPAVKLSLKSASNQPICIEAIIKLVALLGDIHAQVSLELWIISSYNVAGYIVYRQVHHCNILTRTNNRTSPLTPSHYTCVLFIQKSENFDDYLLCRQVLQRDTIYKQRRGRRNQQLANFSTNIATMSHMAVQ